MEDVPKLLVVATDHLSSGNVKDAYFTCVNALDLASKELHNIKFVNNVVTTKPSSITSLFNVSRKCLAFAEDIIIKHQPPSASRKNPNLNIAIYPSSQEEHSFDQANSSQKSPPIIPPKPARRSMTKIDDDELSISPKIHSPALPSPKPPLPPKPLRSGALKKYLRDLEASPSADKVAQTDENAGDFGYRNSEEGGENYVEYSDDSSDSGGEEEDFPGSNASYHSKSDDSTFPVLRRRSSSPNINVSATRRRLTGSLTDSPTDEESPRFSKFGPSSPSWFSTFAMSRHRSMSNIFEFRPQNMISVVPEGSVDPNNLVAASIASEMNSQSPTSPPAIYPDHIPEIPASPLHTQHALLEQRIQTLEAKLSEYRAVAKMREEEVTESDVKAVLSHLSDEDIQETIKKDMSDLANFRQTITRKRQLIFKAAEDPNVLEFAPRMIAYQLSLIEASIFLEIDPLSLLSHSPKNPDPKITASTDFFNYFTRVVEQSVLLPQEASARAQTINHWVKVTVKLHELHNYQTLKAVLSALGTPPIKRLKRTWACIPRKSMTKLETLNEIMSESRNYGKYRETIMQENDEFQRKPVIPFLGTFIMDATYLLAAVKPSGSTSQPLNTPGPVSPSPSPSIQAARAIQDDVRVKELLQTLRRYQTGPRYQAMPPVSYIKASTRHHFRTTSISAALHRSGKYYRSEDYDETIEEQQQFITHYLLTRTWIPEKKVDELSLLREPPKQKNTGTPTSQFNSGGKGSSGSGASGTWNGSSSSVLRESAGSTVGGSGSSTGGNASNSSGMGRTSSMSGSGDSRPNSMEESTEVLPLSLAMSSERVSPVTEKDVPVGGKEKEKEKEKRNITEKVGSFLFRPRVSLDRQRDDKDREKDKSPEKSKGSEAQKERDTSDATSDKEQITSKELTKAATSSANASSSKRTSWRMKNVFGGSEVTELVKSAPAIVKAGSHTRSTSGSDVPIKNSTTSLKQAHTRTSSTTSPTIKSFPYPSVPGTRRSMEETRSSTPPPLYPKPVVLHRSASVSSSSSSHSQSASHTDGRGGVSSGILTGASPTASRDADTGDDEIEAMHMTLARKVASEVVAGSGTLERNRQ